MRCLINRQVIPLRFNHDFSIFYLLLRNGSLMYTHLTNLQAFCLNFAISCKHHPCPYFIAYPRFHFKH